MRLRRWLMWICVTLVVSCGEPKITGKEELPAQDTARPDVNGGGVDSGAGTDPGEDSGESPGTDTWVPPLPGWEMNWHMEELDAVDECEETCFTAQVLYQGDPVPGVSVNFEQEDHGFLGEVITDESGDATVCASSLTTGNARFAAMTHVGDEYLQIIRRLEVRPFGYAFGLSKPLVELSSVPRTPVFERYPDNPVLAPGEVEEWDSSGVMMPSVVKSDSGYFMYYAGTKTGDYSIGVATSDDGLTWAKSGANPLYVPGGEEVPWRRYAANSPTAVVVDGQTKLWFSGRQDEISGISIGLAESEDGINFVELATNPVFEASADNEDWEGLSVAHPTVIHREGVYEMWYSTGLHRIGYAVSLDGVEWTRYCGGPVLRGDSADWEQGLVKASEVSHIDGVYYSTFTAGASGALRLGWAASADGIRWVTTGSPILSEDETSPWDNRSVLAASWRVEDGVLTAWYNGTALVQTGVGVVTASWEDR